MRVRRWLTWLTLGILGWGILVGWEAAPLQWRGYRGWEPESAYCRLYDTHYLVTVKGVIERVEKVVPIKGMGYGTHFVLRTPSETIPIHLGPRWYVDSRSVQFQPEDRVEVTGSRVFCDGKPVILAATVKRGRDSQDFRDMNGRPNWIDFRH